MKKTVIATLAKDLDEKFGMKRIYDLYHMEKDCISARNSTRAHSDAYQHLLQDQFDQRNCHFLFDNVFSGSNLPLKLEIGSGITTPSCHPFVCNCAHHAAYHVQVTVSGQWRKPNVILVVSTGLH